MKISPDLEAKLLSLPGVTVNGKATQTVVETVTEKEFMAAVLSKAKSLGWVCYHTRDSRKSQAGYPDLTMARERLICAELKTETGQVSAAQANWLTALAEAGVECYVWRPSRWSELLNVLEHRGPMAFKLEFGV